MPTDFDSFFRNRIEGLFIRASWSEALRALLGLEAVSQVWSGNAAWYLWLRRAQGVYQLVFSEGEEVEANGDRLFEGHFAVKFYPYPDAPCYGGFSDEERRLVRSDRFDATRTPRFEASLEIPEWLFTVGSISLLCDAEGSLTLLTYQSLDALRVRREDVPSAFTKVTGTLGTAPLVRDVAGWTIGYPLFDCLVGLYVHFNRRPPAFVGATSGLGFEHTVLADGRAVCRSSRERVQTAITIGFHPVDGDSGTVATLWQEGLESLETIQIARRLPASFDPAVGEGLPDNLILNPLWWKIAESDFKSELSSTCGCGQPHCHHQERNGSHEH
jgi:hypothetical protein